jgi:hypothetical protein
MFSDFNALILKIILKNKKKYFNIFLNKKYFKNQLQTYIALRAIKFTRLLIS